MSHVFRCLLGLAGLLFFAGTAWGQNTAGYGDWQLHLPTNSPRLLADTGDRIYVATDNSFYFLDKKQNTTQVLSRRDGLNGVKVVGLAYDSVTQQTVLAYNDGNIDIIRPSGSVRNISDVLRKTIQGTKDIYRVSIGGGKAYVCTSFGLVVLDLTKLEISDTYTNIGPGGTVVPIYDAAVANGALFVATSVGLMRGSLASNLLDYRNWTVYQPATAANPGRRTYPFLAAYNGQVYAAVEGNGLGLFKFVPNNPATTAWRSVNNTYTVQFRNLRASSSGVFIIDDDSGVRRIDRAENMTVVVPRPSGDRTFDAVRSRDGSYYVAYGQGGLQHVRAGQPNEAYVANGPETYRAFSLVADARSNIVDVFTGGYSERYFPLGSNLGFYEYNAGQWTNFTSSTLPSTADFPNPSNPSRGVRTTEGVLYVASFGGGLLAWKGPKDFRQFTSNIGGSPIRTYAVPNNDRISDVTADAAGNVWVLNPHGVSNTSGLYRYTPSTDTWLTVPWAPNLENLDRITLDDQGLVWATVARKPNNPGIPGQSEGGLYAIDPDPATTNRPRFFTIADGLPDNQLYEVAKDRRGYIWVASIKGVAVFSDPSGPFLSAGSQSFTAPIVKRGDGTGFPVLFTEAVRTLAIDGGNRKWFGTDNGLWLFSPDADEALLHFTTANSPLPSNRIIDVKVNDKTGEVWVATDAGVVAYRGTATVTEGSPKCTAVFPNPIRPDFQGTVGISGLANNALVKITDVAGHLVYATTASGGTVTWNMTNPDGQRVRSGTYLVLSTDADGKNGCVSKVAVLSK